MPVTVLVVDDSAFFRQRVTGILNSDPRIKVVGTAENGQVAISKAIELKPDVITMDYEMPVMNGVSALVEIMRQSPTAVLMFSSLTHQGARITLEALDAGAVDFLPKSYERMNPGAGSLDKVLIDRVIEVSKTRVKGASSPTRARSTLSSASPVTAAAPASAPIRSTKPAKLAGKTSLVVFGTSTGGPVAIQKIMTALPASFPVPILIVQHMPKAFTGAFAERLNMQCKIEVKEAVDGDEMKPGRALLAPGGLQMLIDSRSQRVKIVEGDDRLNYKPSVDVTFASAAKHYPGKVLGIVLTGMGADGRDGAKLLKNGGSQIWAQNEESCVIYGMPAAVVQADLADHVLDLSEVAKTLCNSMGV